MSSIARGGTFDVVIDCLPRGTVVLVVLLGVRREGEDPENNHIACLVIKGHSWAIGWRQKLSGMRWEGGAVYGIGDRRIYSKDPVRTGVLLTATGTQRQPGGELGVASVSARTCDLKSPSAMQGRETKWPDEAVRGVGTSEPTACVLLHFVEMKHHTSLPGNASKRCQVPAMQNA